MKERKRLILPGLCRKPIKSLTQDLGFSRRHQAPSRGGVKAQGAFLRESQKPGQESEQDRSLCSKESAGEREIERKKDTGTQSLMEQRCFNDFSVSVYRL